MTNQSFEQSSLIDTAGSYYELSRFEYSIGYIEREVSDKIATMSLTKAWKYFVAEIDHTASLLEEEARDQERLLDICVRKVPEAEQRLDIVRQQMKELSRSQREYEADKLPGSSKHNDVISEIETKKEVLVEEENTIMAQLLLYYEETHQSYHDDDGDSVSIAYEDSHLLYECKYKNFTGLSTLFRQIITNINDLIQTATKDKYLCTLHLLDEKLLFKAAYMQDEEDQDAAYPTGYYMLYNNGEHLSEEDMDRMHSWIDGLRLQLLSFLSTHK